MGLDQYAYVATKANSDYKTHREIAYWRKHPNLHGWMERLWLKKLSIPLHKEDQHLQNQYPPDSFNGIELELSWDDIVELEKDILSGNMASLNTKGFFFGSPSDDRYKEQDLNFIVAAKAEIFLGLKIFYNSSW